MLNQPNRKPLFLLLLHTEKRLSDLRRLRFLLKKDKHNLFRIHQGL